VAVSCPTADRSLLASAAAAAAAAAVQDPPPGVVVSTSKLMPDEGSVTVAARRGLQYSPGGQGRSPTGVCEHFMHGYAVLATTTMYGAEYGTDVEVVHLAMCPLGQWLKRIPCCALLHCLHCCPPPRMQVGCSV
jgi:hypothetical protein